MKLHELKDTIIAVVAFGLFVAFLAWYSQHGHRLFEGMAKYLEARTANILAADVCKAKGKEVKR